MDMQDIYGWWIWSYYFNPATYVLYGTITTQLGDVYDTNVMIGALTMATSLWHLTTPPLLGLLF